MGSWHLPCALGIPRLPRGWESQVCLPSRNTGGTLKKATATQPTPYFLHSVAQRRAMLRVFCSWDSDVTGT